MYRVLSQSFKICTRTHVRSVSTSPYVLHNLKLIDFKINDGMKVNALSKSYAFQSLVLFQPSNLGLNPLSLCRQKLNPRT